MHVLAIDAGSYSVKFISSILDKKRATHLMMREYPVQEAMDQNPDWNTPEEAIQGLIIQIVNENSRPDTRISIHVPPETVTTRFLTLPVKNRKKAELMIPFQLEEDIPFSLAESHFAWSLETGKTQSQALVALTRDQEFGPFYDSLERWETPPSVVTSEASVLDTFYTLNRMIGPCCVLDMGHRSTKAYFFYNSKLIATHVSYVGGRHIDEMIAQTYGIEPSEAVIYKHQNAFVLTESQMKEVDEGQREFAKLMEKVLKPLINDFQRWDLGFRVSHGMRLSQVYLCGGSSNIKNMAHFLTEKINARCSLLETFEGVDTSKVDFNPKSRARYTIANMMVVSLRAKNRLINLLSGRYAQAARGELPLPTLSFIAVRASIVTAVFVVALIIQGVLVNMDIQATNTKLTAVSKNPVLGLTARDKRMMATAPAQVDAALAKKQRAIKQQVSTLQASTQIRALEPLVAIAQLGTNKEATLIKFNVSDAGDVEATFQLDENIDAEAFAQNLASVELQNVKTSISDDKKTVTLTGVQ